MRQQKSCARFAALSSESFVSSLAGICAKQIIYSLTRRCMDRARSLLQELARSCRAGKPNNSDRPVDASVVRVEQMAASVRPTNMYVFTTRTKKVSFVEVEGSLMI